MLNFNKIEKITVNIVPSIIFITSCYYLSMPTVIIVSLVKSQILVIAMNISVSLLRRHDIISDYSADTICKVFDPTWAMINLSLRNFLVSNYQITSPFAAAIITGVVIPIINQVTQPLNIIYKYIQNGSEAAEVTLNKINKEKLYFPFTIFFTKLVGKAANPLGASNLLGFFIESFSTQASMCAINSIRAHNINFLNEIFNNLIKSALYGGMNCLSKSLEISINISDPQISLYIYHTVRRIGEQIIERCI